AGGQRHSVAAFLAADPRRCLGPDALDELFQLTRQLVAVIAIEIQRLQVAREDLTLQRGPASWVDVREVWAAPPQFVGRLHEGQAAILEVDAGVSLGRPD